MATNTAQKHKPDEQLEGGNEAKRLRISEEDLPPQDHAHEPEDSEAEDEQPPHATADKGKQRAIEDDTESINVLSKASYRKLAPPRPFPTVPTSVSATGPRSAHVEGKNYICITRKTPLGAYLRRCKDTVVKDGHKTLHLSAMGAAIPHLMQLALSLPEILPYPPEDIHTEVLTGSVDVQDEVIPEDEDEDISFRTRGKSTVSVVIKIGDGMDDGPRTGKGRRNTNRVSGAKFGARPGQKTTHGNARGARQSGKSAAEAVVVRMEDLEES